MTTRRLKDTELFAVGTWKGKSWTSADLESIVSNFRRFQAPNAPQRMQKVPIVVGHSEKDLANSAIHRRGESIDLRHDGTKLRFDSDGLDDELAATIESGNYDDLSAEIYPEPPEGLRELGATGPMLRRIAVIGGDIPHVKGLNVAGLRSKLAPVGAFAESPKVRIERTVRRGDEYETFSEDVMPTREEMIAECVGAGCKNEIVETFSDEQLAEAVKLKSAPPTLVPTSAVAVVSFSEDERSAIVSQVVAQIVTPIKAQVDESLAATAREIKRQRVEVFVEGEMNRGTINPASMDPTGGVTLVDELIALDDSAKCHTFTEGGVKRELSQLDVAMRRIRHSPQMYKDNGRRIAGGKGGPVTFVETATKATEEKFVAFAESQTAELAVTGQTPKEVIDAWKMADTAGKRMVEDAVGFSGV